MAETSASGSERATGRRPLTNGRSVEERLAELEELYASAPVGLGFLDRDLRYLRVNNRLAEFQGLAADEHPGRALEEVVPDIASKVQEALEGVFASGEPVLGLEVDAATPGTHGLERRWRASLRPVRDERGEILGVSFAVEDLSELAQRIRFDNALSKLSALFINLPPGEVDRAIEKGVAELSQALGLDGGGLLQLDADGSRFRMTHEWRREGIEITLEGEVIDDRYPWLAERLRAGRPVLISRLDLWPPAAAASRADCEALDIRSAAYVPFSLEGSVAGCVALDTIGRETGWSDELVLRLRLAGEIFGNALLRRRRQAEIDERLEFESVLAELSARFVNLAAGEVDGAIEDGLGRLAEILGMDLASLFQRGEPAGRLRITHEWLPVGVDPGFKGVVIEDSWVWLHEGI